MKLERECISYLKRLGRRLRALRETRGWTLEETEEHGWPAWRHLQRIESGKNITVASLWRVAKLYGVSPGDILKNL